MTETLALWIVVIAVLITPGTLVVCMCWLAKNEIEEQARRDMDEWRRRNESRRAAEAGSDERETQQWRAMLQMVNDTREAQSRHRGWEGPERN